jgi:hypothetical protein
MHTPLHLAPIQRGGRLIGWPNAAGPRASSREMLGKQRSAPERAVKAMLEMTKIDVARLRDTDKAREVATRRQGRSA